MKITDISKLSDIGRERLAKALGQEKTTNDSLEASVKPEKRIGKKFEPFSIDVPMELKSLNFYLGKHWAIKNKFKTEVLTYFQYQGLGNFKPCEEKRHVKITRFMGKGQRKFDYENLCGGSAKQTIDALKTLGIIKDDTDEWLSREYAQEKANEAYFRVEVS